MERTALRLATCAALLNGGNGPPWPTVAGEFVYDSMIDDVVDVVPNRRKPVIIVRTDDDQLGYNRYQISGRQCRLLIEFGVLTAVTTKVNNVDEPKVDWPRTDSALEAFLDLLEWQIWCALKGYTVWGQWFQNRANCGTWGGYQSSPRFSAPERGAVRLAVRTIAIAVNLPPECAPRPVKEYAIPEEPVLPASWSNVVCDILQFGGGDFKKSVQELSKVIAAHGFMERPRFPPLHRVWGSLPNFGIEADWRIEQEAPVAADDLVLEPPTVVVPPTVGNP
jgi:hypothetical protein